MLPLLFWLFTRRVHPFIDRAGRAVLNYTAGVSLQVIVLFLLSIFITFTTCGSKNPDAAGTAFYTVNMIGAVMIAIADIFACVVGATYASQGRAYRYPLSINIKYKN